MSCRLRYIRLHVSGTLAQNLQARAQKSELQNGKLFTMVENKIAKNTKRTEIHKRMKMRELSITKIMANPTQRIENTSERKHFAIRMSDKLVGRSFRL